MLITRRPMGTWGIPCGLPAVQTEFMISLANALTYTHEYLCKPEEYIHTDFVRTSFHATARNALASRFLGDYLFMTDTDHEFEPDLLARMVTLAYQSGAMVLSGFYRYRVAPFLPVVYHWDGEAYGVVCELDWNADLVKVDCVGAGVLLIRRPVIDAIRKEFPNEEPFDIIGRQSEDFAFFTRLRQLGIPVHLAPKIESWHLGVRRITNDLYDPKSVPKVPIPSGGERVAGPV